MDIKTLHAAYRREMDAAIESQLEKLKTAALAIDSSEPQPKLLDTLGNVSQGGKRLRPFLVHNAYQSYADDTQDSTVRDMCVAVELFHIFCLIHDDVIDKATSRHHQMTINHFAATQLYADRMNGIHLGNSQAILYGDLLFNEVYSLVARSAQRFDTQDALLEHFSNMVREVCIGQVIDVNIMGQKTPVWETIVRKNTLKTAYYSFVRPLQLGVLMACGANDDIVILEKIGQELGLLYQLQDDLLDVSSPETGKAMYTDIMQGQPTFVTAFLRERNPAGYTTLTALQGKELSEADMQMIADVLADAAVPDAIQKQIETHAANAITLLDSLSNQLMSKFLGLFIEYLMQRTS